MWFHKMVPKRDVTSIGSKCGHNVMLFAFVAILGPVKKYEHGHRESVLND